MSNYRPIALVPVISKIFEKVLKLQLVNHFEQHNLFFNNQYGFRRNKSTTGALLKLIEVVVDGMERGNIVGADFYDLTKAFDCVSPRS